MEKTLAGIQYKIISIAPDGIGGGIMGKSLGERLTSARIALGLTQAELAKIVKCTQKDICLWEKGVREPKVRSLRRLADALGRTLDELVPDCDSI